MHTHFIFHSNVHHLHIHNMNDYNEAQTVAISDRIHITPFCMNFIPLAGLASWVVPDTSRSAQLNGSQPISPSANTQSNRLAKQTPPTAADFPDLPGSGPSRSGSSAKVKSAAASLPSHTSRSGVQPSESKRSGPNHGRASAVADAHQSPTDLSSSAPRVLIRSRQHRNADIRFGLTETLSREVALIIRYQNYTNHHSVSYFY